MVPSRGKSREPLRIWMSSSACLRTDAIGRWRACEPTCSIMSQRLTIAESTAVSPSGLETLPKTQPLICLDAGPPVRVGGADPLARGVGVSPTGLTYHAAKGAREQLEHAEEGEGIGGG